MHTIEAIHSRRSIRSYTDQEISKADLQEIIECGMYAPSAHNQQAREFFILQDKEKQNHLGEMLQFGKMIPNAKAIIITCFNKELTKAPTFIQQDMGACVQNILLAAHEKEIGAVRIGIYGKENQDKNISNYLNIPEHLEIFNCIALWYRNNEKPLREKECIKPEKIHWL